MKIFFFTITTGDNAVKDFAPLFHRESLEALCPPKKESRE